MKRLATLIASAVAVLGLAGALATSASAETATSVLKITPKGSLFKEAFRPVTVTFGATVHPDPGQLKLPELKNVNFTVPKSLTFDMSGSKVCKKDIGQIDPVNAIRPTAAIIAECPKSVLGTGTATINIAGIVAAAVTDPILTIFNGGEDKKGHPIMLIHGYSATAVPGGHGVMMKAVLKNGHLDVAIPTLAANSAVTTFSMDIPSANSKDPKVAQATCPGKSLDGTAVLTLGTYNPDSGQYENLFDLSSNESTNPCHGKRGHGKFARLKVNGPKRVKKGKKGTYKVRVKNRGTATIKRLKVVAKGKGAKGKRSAGKLAPGDSKTIRVKVKFTKKGKSKVKFKATGKGAKAKTKNVRVKVK